MAKLYGVGVGPGDPDLLTIKALKVIRSVKHLFVASSTKNQYSLACRIISPHLPAEKEIKRLSFPMTYKKDELKRAWEENARVVAKALKTGDAAFLTLGDPNLYSTFSYLVREILKLVPDLQFEIVPGITAAQAAAARLKLTLAEGDETVLIASGAQGGEAVRQWAQQIDTLVLYKVYRQAEDILKALAESGRLKEVRGISFCGMPEEKIYSNPSSEEGPFPYFTLFIVGGKALK